MRRLKVLHIGKFYYPYRGGIESILQDICEGVASSGHDVRVICSNTKMQYSEEVINNVHVFRFAKLTTLFSQPINITMIFHLYKHIKWSDIIHIHSPNPLLELFCLFFNKNKKVVSTHHSDIVRQKFLKILYLPFWKKFADRVSVFIVPTHNHIKYSTMINSFEQKTKFIPFAIRKERFEKYEVHNLVEKIGPFFLFVGRLVEYKGLQYLIKAMSGVNSSLVIIGEGDLGGNLEELIKENQLEDKIHLLGRLSQEFTNYFYSQCTALVLPSISPNENFGVVQIEAMSFSKPVITTNIKSGVPLVGIKDVTTLIVDPKDSEALEKAMTKLENDPELSKEMGKQAKILFGKKYTYELMINSHIELYNELLNED